MTSYILLVAAVILLCLSLNKMSNKLGIPMLLAYILLGMMFGTDGILKIPFDNFTIAEQICTVSLIFIMFYGGFGTNWKQAKPVAGKAVLLSTVGVILTAVTTGAFCHFILKMDFWESMLIGSVISSTDAASVFSILRSKRLNLKNNTASMLEVESGSNDPCSYMLTVIILTIMSGELSGSSLVVMIFSQIIFGILVGVVVALAAAFILKKVNFATDGFDTIFVFSMALVSYAGASMINGNGYLAAYIAGIILGNSPLHHKKSLVHFFDGITGLMQMLIFFLLGLLAYPSQLPKILPIALAIAVFLTFVARPISVFAILTPFRCPVKQQLLVSWAGLRGAASIVFAIMATVSPAYTKNDLFHIVIFIVLFSISIQGTLLGFVAKKLDMIDENGNVMKTFSDYSDEMPVEFVKISIKEGHPWENRRIKDLTSLPDLLLVLILRGEERIIPNGNTVVLAGDKIVLSALSPEENLGICLTEIPIEKDSKWIGKPLSKIKLGEEKLVLVLKRNEKVVIPNGNTVIRENDVLVISQL
ncbi:potassium/proton antiporter [Thermoguttaceae bacterium LCP21S3_D4]|nr:potassium/proton antiporter [Lachnospiraceae bacterium]MDD6303568.1 potassium/proton antiporter [Lachnospiraceae bacterium]HCJ75109.1 potassium/proton antiporter [Roseburia sp.]